MSELTLRATLTSKPDSICLEASSDRNPRGFAQAMGDYLKRFEWHHIAHLTYQYSPSVDRIKHDVEDRWLRRAARNAQQPLRWFYVVECGGSGLHHVHALVWGTACLTVGQLERGWKYGLTKILRYDATRGAAQYLTKQLNDFPDNWSLSKFGWHVAADNDLERHQ